MSVCERVYVCVYVCASVSVCERVCVCKCVCGARIRRAPMSWLRTRSAYRIIVDHSGKEYFHHIQCNTTHKQYEVHVQIKYLCEGE